MRPPVTPERVALSWLHVLSEHPNNLSRYKWALSHPGKFVRVTRYLWNSMGIAENLIRSLWSPVAYPTVDSESFPEQIDVLFISHLVSAQTGSADPDFYYGRLPEQLASRGLSSLVALKNHVPHNEKILRDRLTRGGATSRILLPRSSTFGREIHMYCHAGAVASALRQDALEGQSALQRSVALEAVRNAKTRATIASLRLHAAVKQLCERFRPRALIVTWEGHAWERLAFHAARMVDPSVRCIGYQHTVLLPRAHALKRSLERVMTQTSFSQ